MNCDDSEFLEEQLAEVEDQIREYRQAIRSVMNGQSYTLDTGQTKGTVTRANLSELRNYVASLMNERTMLRQQLGCGGSTHITPAF